MLKPLVCISHVHAYGLECVKETERAGVKKRESNRLLPCIYGSPPREVHPGQRAAPHRAGQEYMRCKTGIDYFLTRSVCSSSWEFSCS
ncbi:uncharacterized protein LOC143174769 isoform X2 [Nomia melanderi]|uniref:uncharacterized protein LOC143174769 isoform X2 n=1 Tax=Nomia melanderi TaxID=2448451 RepID=UPI003FCE8123